LSTSASTRRIALPSLSEEAVGTLARSTDIDPVALHRRTVGNPFFVTEVLASGASGVPANVRDAVLARAARLSLSARAVLEAAAVIGMRIEPWLLAQVTGTEAAATEACMAAGMLQAQGDALAFQHELSRQTMLEATSPQRRLMLHQLTLAALRASPAPRRNLARLAHHAEGTNDREAVLEFAPATAQQAAKVGAHREAVAQYALAL
jgi:hypothetical protein